MKHIIHHEISHLEHPFVNGTRDYLDIFSSEFTRDDFTEIALKVSRYAVNEPADFVAEVRCGLLEGKGGQYSDRIMELYRLLHGPK